MIERICPKCRVPMDGEKCIKPDCRSITEMASTIYWCKECNVPIFDKTCPICGGTGEYIATDVRPVFPEENVLFSLIVADDPVKNQKSSVWFGSGVYIVDGKKVSRREEMNLHKRKKQNSCCYRRLLFRKKMFRSIRAIYLC